MNYSQKSAIPVIFMLSFLGLASSALAIPDSQISEKTQLNPTSIDGIDSNLQSQLPITEDIPWYGVDHLEQQNPENNSHSGQTSNLVDLNTDLNKSLDQVNSVNQLTDVKPTDWAYEALRSLVDRYGCVAGFPNQTYRGNQALSRYEFAAGLNSCLSQIERLIASSEAVVKEDLDTINRLTQEFEAELAEIGGRVDDLESRIAYLEDVQFSTTTKISGFITFGVTDYFTGEGETETVLQDEVLMYVTSSFTGKDKLEVGLIADSFDIPELDTPNNNIGTNVAARNQSVVNSTSEGLANQAFEGTTGNNLRLSTIEYTFPIIKTENVTSLVTIFANRRFASSARNIGDEWVGPGKPISAFAKRSPIYRLGGNSGALIRFKLGDTFRIGASYQATPGDDPTEGNGFFDGNYFATIQTVITPNDKLSFALTYANTYSTPGAFKFSRRKGNPNLPGGVGTSLANVFDNAGVFFNENEAVISNAYGFQGFYQLTPGINIGGFVTKIDSRIIGRGDADIWTYAGMLTLSDLFKEGNTGGLVIGAEPYLASLDARVDFDDNFDNDTSLHIEAYYQHQLTKGISITPSVIWITAPNQDKDNDDLVIGTVQTVFSF